jgi:fructoselysine 6-kinase
MDNLAFGTIGDNTVDQYFGAENSSYVGGNAVNVAVKLAGLGGSVHYAGAVGADADGERVRAALEGNGVLTNNLTVLPGITSISRIRVKPDGDRVIEFEDFAVSADYVPSSETMDTLGRCAIVHIGMSPVATEVRAALRARGTIVSQDCAVSAGFSDLDIAFCSAGEEPGVARRLATEAVAGGAALAVATRGAEGSVAFDGTTWWEVAAEPIEALDTTGAGDGYIAGFLDALARGLDTEACMLRGSAVAAKTCQHWGGFEQEAVMMLVAEKIGGIDD